MEGNAVTLALPDWSTAAVCAQVDADLWFPEAGGFGREAKRICSTCPVQTQCLQWALDHDESWGIWGGYSTKDRRRIKHGLPLPKTPQPPNAPGADNPNVHGYRRYKRGCRCTVCKAAWAQYQRDYHAAQGIPPKLCQVCQTELHGRGRHRYCSQECKRIAYAGKAA